MAKSPTQLLLEAKRHKDICDIVIGALDKYRGKKNMAMLVSVDLEISDATLYRWCEDLDIDINEYRKQEVSA